MEVRETHGGMRIVKLRAVMEARESHGGMRIIKLRAVMEARESHEMTWSRQATCRNGGMGVT